MLTFDTTINTFIVDDYYSILERTPSVKKNKTMVSAGTIKDINKLMKCAFNVAKKWELVRKNPFENATLPEVKSKQREDIASEDITQLLNECDDPKLIMSIHLSYACTMREGEVLGLQWKKVFLDDKLIKADDAYIIIDTQLQRLSIEALEETNYKEVSFRFPAVIPNPNRKTELVLKTCKSGSERKVWIPSTLATLLKEWKTNQDEMKALFKNEYNDYDLVVCLENGRPCTQDTITASWRRLRNEYGLDKDVVFHCFRHSSVTDKLVLNNGDVKSVQGDSGHKQLDMVTQVYSHIKDSRRKGTAKKFDKEFYKAETKKDDDLKEVLEALISSQEVKDLVNRLVED